MPFYDYKCKKCGNVQEELHSITKDPEIKCKKCNSPCKRMMPSEVNYILKGSGWASKEIKLKKDMTKKNSRMKGKMKERERSGEGVNNIEDLKKISN